MGFMHACPYMREKAKCLNDRSTQENHYHCRGSMHAGLSFEPQFDCDLPQYLVGFPVWGTWDFGGCLQLLIILSDVGFLL